MYTEAYAVTAAHPTKQLPHSRVWPEHIKWDDRVKVDMTGLIISSCYHIQQIKSSLTNVIYK
jgi:hypothetical protein